MESYDPNYIKAQNRKLVFDLFMAEGELSRAEITRKTTMSFPTVLKVVNFFISKKLVYETGINVPSNDGAGRKGRLLKFNPNAYGAVGIVFEGKYINMGFVNLNGEIIDSLSLNTDENIKEFMFSLLIDRIEELINNNKHIPCLGVGIGLPRAVNPGKKTIIEYTDTIIREISFEDYAGFSPEIFQVPLFIENDVKITSIGEMFLRKNSEIGSLVYISLGSGLGSAIILDGKVHRGVNFLAGEIGSLIINNPDLVDYKNLSKEAVEKKINIKAIKDKFGIDIRKGLNVSEALKQEITEYIANYLAIIIYNYVHILDVDEFVITGIIPEFLGDEFYQYLRFFIRKLLKTGIKITPSVNADAGVIGAGVMVFNNTIMDSVLS
ncbi:MAG: ROK family protein [Clostridiaceae bacterium]|nr:ROK family protein [Clostridiaceae bacterium]